MYFLKGSKHRTQINNNFSSEEKVIAGVAQGSIDGPLLLNTLINDIITYKEELILEKTIDNKLTFDSHKKSICRKAGQNLRARYRIITIT